MIGLSQGERWGDWPVGVGTECQPKLRYLLRSHHLLVLVGDRMSKPSPRKIYNINVVDNHVHWIMTRVWDKFEGRVGVKAIWALRQVNHHKYRKYRRYGTHKSDHD